MNRQAVVAGLMAAEREMQLAQLGLDGSVRASVRYRNATARLVHLERLAVLLINMSDPAATVTG